jgi:hypothetical protein
MVVALILTAEDFNMTFLTEALDYMDLERQIYDKFSIDEYAARAGKDCDIVTLAFKVKSKLAAEDLTKWFERGYDWVIDASTSEGELDDGNWLVFVELLRRMTVPLQIIELLEGMQTLTGIKVKDWAAEVGDDEYEVDEKILRQVLILNPLFYRKKEEQTLSESIAESIANQQLEQKQNTNHLNSLINDMRRVSGLPIIGEIL